VGVYYLLVVLKYVYAYDKSSLGGGDNQLLMWYWTQGNAVPAPPVTEIQRSHTSDFIERVQYHLLGAHFGPNLIIQFPHLWFSTLTTVNNERRLTSRCARHAVSTTQCISVTMVHCYARVVRTITRLLLMKPGASSVLASSLMRPWFSQINTVYHLSVPTARRTASTAIDSDRQFSF